MRKEEPSEEDTIAILRGLKERYEFCTTVWISPTGHHRRGQRCPAIADRQLPDKAIDLVDEAASRIRMEIDSAGVHRKLERRLIS